MTSKLSYIKDLMIQKVLPRMPQRIYTWYVKLAIRRQRGKNYNFDWNQEYKSASNQDWQKLYDDLWAHQPDDGITDNDISWLKKHLKNNNISSILEIGVGAGKLSRHLSKLGYNVTLLDISQQVLGSSKLKQYQKIQARAESLPFRSNSFDMIIASHILEHVSSLKKTITEWIRVSKKLVVIIIPQESQPPFPTNYHLHYFPNKPSFTKLISGHKYQISQSTNPYNKKIIRCLLEVS